jgi:hypothetical protein
MEHGASGPRTSAARFTVGRINDNELILFDEAARESWIVYPPRSGYTHLHRPTRESAVVEHHPWAPLSPAVYHAVTALSGCAEHGLECGAYGAIKAGAEMGWNAFA